MGSRKLLIFFIFLLSIFSCNANENISISNIKLTENSLNIEVNLENVKVYRIINARIEYKNIQGGVLRFSLTEISYEITNEKMLISLDLTDKILYTNEDAEIFIGFSGGSITGNVFIGNPFSNIDSCYTFPSQAYEKIKIIILNQRYFYRI